MPEIIINGPEGRLEGRYRQGPRSDSPVAIVLHPHPLHGGNMNNKVVYSLYQTFAVRGFSVLRFNFRGVGRSEGKYDAGIGELSDAAYAFDWMQQYNPNAPVCWIAGYSFGALIAMQLMMRRPEINGFIAVSPPANTEDFSFLAPCPSSGMILHGEIDEAVPVASAQRLAQKLTSQKNITVEFAPVKGADHFYTDRMDQMEKAVEAYLDAAIAETAEAAG